MRLRRVLVYPSQRIKVLLPQPIGRNLSLRKGGTMSAMDIVKRRAAEAERNRQAMPITTRWVHQVREDFPDAKVKRVTESGQSLGKPSGDYEVRASDMHMFKTTPLARSTDPQTSHDAAKRIIYSNRIQETIDKSVAALQKYGPMIPAEIALKTGIHYSEIQRRGKPAEEGGYITRGPETRDGQTVWKVSR